jgi:ABC-2 type transport system permease protein
MLLLVNFLVAFLYLSHASYEERRDSSLLFWKTLPVSDVETLVARALVGMLVVPLATMSGLIALHPLVAVFGSATSLGDALFLLAVETLWHAPLFAWVLLASGFAKRAPLAVAVLPIALLGGTERLLAGTTNLVNRLLSRGPGDVVPLVSPTSSAGDYVPRLTALGNMGLLFGVAVAAALVLIAARQRRLATPC